MHDDTLSHHEFDTEPFTTTELTAIMGYRTAIEGIPDAIMETTPAEMGAAATAFGPAAAKNLLTDHCDALNTWFLALDQALAELLTCTTESTRYSTAAGRFLTAETAAYHRARQHFEHTTTVFLLGRDTAPLTGNYPRFTSSLNLPMQCFEDE
ncbi:hypothetical protein ACPCSC_30640 [Streptomyces lavendulocolor]|uniref:hypothetical protein n=1 Tax=Streptomyces lavendulocolor TaxID=67316 RepID=UPI003C2F901A